MNNNIINTTIISIIVAFFLGIIFNATYIAPVAAEAEVEAAIAVRPIHINAKRAIALNAGVDCLEEDQSLVSKVFAKTFEKNDFEFGINHNLISYDHEIKTNLDDIRNMIKRGNYQEASKAIKEYRHLLREQVRDGYKFLPMGYMFMCLVNADKLGVSYYFEN